MDKDDIARIRSLPLEAVLHSLGAERDPKDPAHNWRVGASRITVTEARFFDHNAAGALHRMREGRAGGGGAPAGPGTGSGAGAGGGPARAPWPPAAQSALRKS